MRTLPLPDDLAGLVRSLRSRLADELGLMAVKPDAAVAVDQAGRPLHPDAYSDEWLRMVKRAGVRSVTIKSARASSVTVMRLAGVPDFIVAAWHGHDEAVMAKHYSRANTDPMRKAGETYAAATRSG